MFEKTRGTNLLTNLFQLLEAHRSAFKQERPFLRMVGLMLGEVFNFGRHTVSQELLTLGMKDGDWSAWYRLFSRERYDEEQLSKSLLLETLEQVSVNEPYWTVIDGTAIHRSSLTMPGSSWLRDSRFSAFRPGIHRAQRFLHGAWLTPMEKGYSRAIPLRFLPAFPEKAVASNAPARREWDAGGVFIKWVRKELDNAGRTAQPLVVLGDGGFDVIELWRGLPERTVLITRTARNRCLYYLPKPVSDPGPGRPASYGEHAPHPSDWLHAGLRDWPSQLIEVRGKFIPMKYQVLGPFVRDGLPEKPLFLIVVKGMHRLVGKRRPHYKHREPSFFLVSAIQTATGDWGLPIPIKDILTWLWQRWEIEVAHREMKSGLGVGEKQCWNKRSSIISVQWSVWVYAVLLLAGYRTWGLCSGPPTPARWWPGAKRWSLNTLWRGYRSELWNKTEFRPCWTPTSDNWRKKEAWLTGLDNSVPAAARI